MDKIKNSELLFQCVYCRKIFERKDISLIAEEIEKTIFHATCSRCLTSAILVLSENPKGPMGVGIVTDLDRSEAAKKFAMKAISADEVIDAYQFFSATGSIKSNYQKKVK